MKKKVKPNVRRYSLILILIAMVGICSVLSDSFLTTTNLTNILKQVSIVTICAFAQGMIIITGEIDLSIGYLAGMSGTFACILYVATGNLVLAFLFGIFLGALVGAVNGLFVAHFKLPAFIVTLAMQSVCFGAVNFYTGGQNVYKIGDFKMLGQSDLFGFLPITVFFMLLMLAITHVVLRYTKFGRYLYAIGGNSEAANAAGVQVRKMKWIVFIVSGIFAAIAGMVMMGRLNAGIPSEGRGFETDAITATVIGGTSFSGGAGTAFGTFLGALIIGVLNNIMNLLGIDSYVQMIVKGFIIIVAVLVDSFSKKQGRTIKIMASTFDVKK
ncbi:ABC transporter permease [Faecalicatena contorta]|uniref:Inositol transport system permease protein n=1 Tax=Faecalicatena contorta TaxID=39482 RepID=A0A315ZYW4_9FIRM|nr:ABC transporter permease [Faecalicatena contorta]PWJ50513.1 inositol transport system permease protein [Faecalicatena contorta]SUQ13921.1 inositol transport system permease protein [Faecalicatena contorta]